MSITLEVNGAKHKLTLAPETALIFVLRNDLGLASPKLGCGLEQCGACAVLVDGEVRYSCTTSLKDVSGCRVETVEGFAPHDQLSPLQVAFLENNAGQCGYCLSGILIRVKALLVNNPSPSRIEIKQALKPHLCRCGAHPRILRAIERVIGKAYMGFEPDTLPPHITADPQLHRWVLFSNEGKVVIATGKVEIGQGIKTAIAMIAAEELEVAIERIEVRTAHTALVPDESITAGSLSIEDSGSALRVASASARQVLLEKAAEVADRVVRHHRHPRGKRRLLWPQRRR